MTTRRIRMVVLMTPEGLWDSRGWGYLDGNESDEELRSAVKSGALAEDLDRGARVSWVEADVPVPEVVEVVEGTVGEAGDD